MKKIKLLLFAMALISSTTTFALSQAEDKKEVPVKEVHDISDGVIPHRAPYRKQCPVKLFLNETEGAIEFIAYTDIYNINVNIYDEQENTICTSIIDIYANETTSVSISDLTSGEYRIEVIINDNYYEGIIDII